MSEIVDLFEKPRQLSDEKLERFLADLGEELRAEVRQRLSATMDPTNAEVDPLATTDQESANPRPQVPPPREIRVVSGGTPKVIGPYKVLQRIGEGGMGQVYLAEQNEPVKRRVALKVINTDTPDVYSLGVILYELLIGSTPIGRERLRVDPFDRILALIREEDAPRPSQRLSDSGDAISVISE